MNKTLIALMAAAAAALPNTACHKHDHNKAPVEQVYVCEDQATFLLDENQKMGDHRETLIDFGLSNLLRGSSIVNAIDASQINQYLRFGTTNAPFMNFGGLPNDPRNATVFFGENELDVIDYHLFFKDGNKIFEYELEFENGLESRIDPVTGRLTDLRGHDINILGDIYRIVEAQRVDQQLDMRFMRGSHIKNQTMADGQQNHTIGNKEYAVTVVLNPAEGLVRYNVNGEDTPLMNPGEIYVLADGMRFGQMAGTPTRGTTFAFNADALRWADENTNDNLESSIPPERSGEVIEDAKVKIVGSNLPNGNYELSQIKFSLFADGKLGDIYIGKNQNLRGQLDEPEGIPGDMLDIVYAGKGTNGKHIVRVCDGANK